MNIFPPEPDVDLYNQGFGDADILQRKKVGEALTDLLERIDDPLVVALDGPWGAGKTYFLRRWIGAHTIENGSVSTTVYFDAFAHDYLSDPLPALVSALAERLPSGSEEIAQRVKKAAFKLAKPVARMVLAVATAGTTEAFGNLGDAAAEVASGDAATALENYWKQESGRRVAMEEFKDALEALVRPTGDERTGSSLVFVIDELDRCRPDYALEVLEVIKHFFSVPHVHFVLGVNLRTLENSVKVSYGKNIDAQAYLKKFIQITLELPEDVGEENNKKSANIIYLENILESMDIPNHISRSIIEKTNIISKYNYISIRDIRNIVSSVLLVGDGLLKNEELPQGWVDVSVDLLIAKYVKPDIYRKFLDAAVNKEDLAAYFGATGGAIYRETGDGSNPNYEHAVFKSYVLWLFIAPRENVKQLSDETLRSVSRQFGPWGYDGDSRKIPMEAHRKWLDRFTFYTPD